METNIERITNHLVDLYGQDVGVNTAERLLKKLDSFRKANPIMASQNGSLGIN